MSSGGSRVMITAGVKKTIQNIKEITDNKHSDEDIHSVLIECSMDPNETIQKLLYLDTFHVVKRKPDRKKEVSNNRSYEDSRQGGGQGRGGRGWRGSNSSQDGSRGRNSAPQKENRVNRSSERGSVPASDQTKNKEMVNEQKSLPVAVKDLSNVANGTSTQGSDSQALAGVHALVADGSSVNKLPSTLPDVKHHPDAKSKPTFASRVKAGKKPPMSNSNHRAVPSVGSVPSSVSTPVAVPSSVSTSVAVPSLNSGTPDAVSANNRCKVSTQQVIAEPSLTAINESNTSQTNHVPETVEESNPISTASGITASLDTVMPDQPKEVVEDQPPTSNSDIQLAQRNSSSEVFISESGRSATVEAVSQGSPELSTEHESAESQLSDVQHVIFPNHFRVPEEYKVGLTFGSFDVSPGFTSTIVDDSICQNTSSEPVDTFQAIDETAEEPSLSNQSVSSTAPEVDYMDRSQSPENVQENPVTPSDGGDSIIAAPKFDQPKQETLFPIGGPPFPVAQTVQNYYGFLPPMVGTQPMQFEKSDSQGHLPSFTNGNSLPQSTTPPPSQHTGVAQSSIPLSPQQVPMFRQAYPHNYLPYTHYLSPYFMPPMLLGHGGYQQQPPSGYLPQPAASATATKYPLPPYKPLASLGNQGHIGIPGPFTSTPAAYGLSNTVGSGGNNDNEDFTASHLKENNMYPSGQQTEGSPVWIAAPSRETPGMLANPYYNLPPHGQHVAFSPTQSGQGAFAGLYHQSMTAPSTYHPLQQSQNSPGSAEAVGHPPPASYQQQQGAQMNWNGTSY